MFGRPPGFKLPRRSFDFFFRMGRSNFSGLTRFRMGQKSFLAQIHLKRTDSFRLMTVTATSIIRWWMVFAALLTRPMPYLTTAFLSHSLWEIMTSGPKSVKGKQKQPEKPPNQQKKQPEKLLRQQKIPPRRLPIKPRACSKSSSKTKFNDHEMTKKRPPGY